MNVFLSVVNLLFDPSGGPFGLHDEASTNRPIEFLYVFSFFSHSYQIQYIQYKSNHPSPLKQMRTKSL